MLDVNWLIVASLAPIMLLALYQADLAMRVVRVGYNAAARVDRWLSR